LTSCHFLSRIFVIVVTHAAMTSEVAAYLVWNEESTVVVSKL
jgi:hypothetical protein